MLTSLRSEVLREEPSLLMILDLLSLCVGKHVVNPKPRQVKEKDPPIHHLTHRESLALASLRGCSGELCLLPRRYKVPTCMLPLCCILIVWYQASLSPFSALVR